MKWLSLAPVLLLSTLPAQLDSCGEVPEPTCEAIGLEVDALGTTFVSNLNNSTITYDLHITASTCTNSECYATGDYAQQVLPPGTNTYFRPNAHSDFCADVYCCDEGAIYNAFAHLTLLDTGCTLEVEVSDSSTCEGLVD